MATESSMQLSSWQDTRWLRQCQEIDRETRKLSRRRLAPHMDDLKKSCSSSALNSIPIRRARQHQYVLQAVQGTKFQETRINDWSWTKISKDIKHQKTTTFSRTTRWTSKWFQYCPEAGDASDCENSFENNQESTESWKSTIRPIWCKIFLSCMAKSYGKEEQDLGGRWRGHV